MLNNITLGDSYKVLKEIPENSVDLVIIDPPYEFGQCVGAGAFGTKKRNYHEEYLNLYKETGSTQETERLRISANKDKSRESTRFISKGFSFDILDELQRIMKATNIYIWCSKAQVGKIINYYEEKACNIDILTWHKTNPVPTCNNTYLSDTEYCIFARQSGVKLGGALLPR